jgi:hypothetical protein
MFINYEKTKIVSNEKYEETKFVDRHKITVKPHDVLNGSRHYAIDKFLIKEQEIEIKKY